MWCMTVLLKSSGDPAALLDWEPGGCSRIPPSEGLPAPPPRAPSPRLPPSPNKDVGPAGGRGLGLSPSPLLAPSSTHPECWVGCG